MSVVITSIDTLHTITLPNMDFGDSERHKLGTKFKITASSKIYTYKNNNVVKNLLLRFSKLTATNVSDLITFLGNVASKKVTITLPSTASYTGVLQAETLEIITRNVRDTSELPLSVASIQFEGK